MSLSTRKAWHLAAQSLIAAGALTLAGCDGGQVGEPASDGLSGDGLAGDGLAGDLQYPNNELRTSDGTLISQRSAGAKVCFDINQNRRCDTLEPNTTASADGKFSLIQDKSPADIIAELPADQNGTIVRLFAHASSPTVSALTTVLHWSAMSNPTRPVDQISAELEQMLALNDLDSSAPQSFEAPDSPPLEENLDTPLSDENPSEEAAQEETETEELAESVEETTADESFDEVPVVDPLANTRLSIELLIAKITKAAETDALAAGLDPGMDANQSLLNMLVADQSLQQLPALAALLLDSDGADAQAMVDSLPDTQWPADDIILAMQMFAGDAPMEADPITLLEDGLNALMKQCADAADCPIQQTALLLDDDMNLVFEDSLMFSDGSLEDVASMGYEVNNLVLLDSGEWQNLDTSRMASVIRSGEYQADMTDGNDITFSLRATAREIAGTPVEPLLDTLGLSTEDFPSAHEVFDENAKLVSLQLEQQNDRYELLYMPSTKSLERAAAMQALEQASTTLDRLERSFDQADESLSEEQYASEQSTEDAAAAGAQVEALETAITAIEAALEEAQAALEEASADATAVTDSEDLIAAYESVLSDAKDKVEQLKDEDRESTAALTAAQTIQTAAASAAIAAEEALNAIIASTEVTEESAVEEPATEEPGTEEPATVEDEATVETEVVDPAVAEAEAIKLQAERDLIVADAELATAEAASLDSIAALSEAEAEETAAEDALTEAEANQLSNSDTETALQSAELLVSANEANLQLIEQQLIEAEAHATEMGEIADDDASNLSDAQSTLDKLAAQVATAIDTLAAAQADSTSAPMPLTGGCDGMLPAQSPENYNCASIERRIGDAPATIVPTLSELTSTQSTLTLLKLHSDYAVTMLPSDGANTGDAVWHGTSDSFDSTDDSLPTSQWSKQVVNGVSMITVEVPAALQEAGSPSELFMTEQDNYVRPGVVIHAGEVSTETLLNDTALNALLP